MALPGKILSYFLSPSATGLQQIVKIDYISCPLISMIKTIFCSVAALCCTFTALASPADSSATITAAKEKFIFVYNSKTNTVEVERSIDNLYTSNAYEVSQPIVENYNDEITIDDVNCKVDDRTPKSFKPEYSYYSEGDVFYSDSRVCYFPLNLPKKNSKGEVTFKETILDPRYFTSVFFTDELPVTSKEISFFIPKWMKVELKEFNFAGYNIKKSATYDARMDADIITYTASNIPAFKAEAHSPGPTYIYPHIMVLCKSAAVTGHNFTYFGTLDDQYAWYRQLVKSLSNSNEAISAKARELTNGMATDMDKIKAVFYYVQDNIRYIAFENGIAGFRPEKADEVLRKKYGDCKGMANLTKSLLTSLGYDARLCWLGTNHIAYDYQTPSMAVDNHMICALNYKGKLIYLDATESYLGINDYAERIQGRQVLMENGDKYILTRVPVATTAQNYDFETSKLSIIENALTGSISHVWKGEDKEMILSGLNSIKKENTEEAMTKYLSGGNSDYAISDLSISNTANPDKDVTVNYKADIKNGVSVFSKAYYVDLDQKKEYINATIKTDERKHDYWFDFKENLCRETELALPPNYKVSGLPADLNIINDDYEFHLKYISAPGKITYKKNILIKNTHLPTAKFAAWNKDIEQLGKAYNETIVLKPANE